MTPDVVALLDIHWDLGYPDSDKEYTINLGDYVLEDLEEKFLTNLIKKELETFGLKEIKLESFFSTSKVYFDAVHETFYSKTDVNVRVEGYQALKIGNSYFKLEQLEVKVD